MKFRWHDETYEALDQNQMNWVEVSQLEEKTGLTSEELSADKRLAGRALVTAAVCWISIKRQNPTVTWDDFSKSPIADLEFDDDEPEAEAEPAPTARPADDPLDGGDGSTSSTSDGSTSPPSRSGSGSARGSGSTSRRRKASPSSST